MVDKVAKEINLKVIKQKPLDFDEFVKFLNDNELYDDFYVCKNLFNVKSDGTLKVYSGKIPDTNKVSGLVTNPAPHYVIRTGIYLVDGVQYTFEDTIKYLSNLFSIVVEHESAYGSNDDITVIKHEKSGRYLRCYYNYQSYEGYVYDECRWHEVIPETVERVEYAYANKK